MQIRQLRSDFGQTHLAWSELVTGGATELVEALSPLTLRGRAPILGHLGDNAHRLQRGNASFKPLCSFLAFLREAEFALLADGVALLATVSVKKVLGQLSLALAGGDHPVQRDVRGLRQARRCHEAAAKQNDRRVSHDPLDSNPASSSRLSRSLLAPKRWARPIDGREAKVASERIGAVVGQILNVHPACGSVVKVHLHGRVAHDEVSADDVSLDSRSQKYSIRIPDNGIVLNHVAGIAGSDQTHAEIVPLRCVSISTKPVPTEPVAAGAASQSYAAAGIAAISIAHRNVANDAVVGPAGEENPGETVGGSGHARDCAAGTVEEPDALPAKLFH
jgi:hypothetical protein